MQCFKSVWDPHHHRKFHSLSNVKVIGSSLINRNIETGLTNNTVLRSLQDIEDGVVQFANSYLENNQSGDDYREFTELMVLIFLSSFPQRGVQFMAPGATHHAVHVYAIKVVNDLAECSMALIQEFNGLMTHSELQLQYLLQVLQQHRQAYPDTKKETLSVKIN